MNKKKLLALLMALVMTLTLVPVTAFATEAETVSPINVDGIDESVYLVSDGFYQDGANYDATTDFYITNLAGLKYFRDWVNGTSAAMNNYYNQGFLTLTLASFASNNPMSGKNVHLLSDIDLTGEVWQPIGPNSGSVPDRFASNWKAHFYGSFYGHNHIITNMDTSASDQGDKYSRWPQGFFGSIATAGCIDGLVFVNPKVVSNFYAGYAGVVVGDAGSNSWTISNCSVTGNITVTGGYSGGICGIGNVNISNCTVDATGTITGNQFAGGLVGAERCSAASNLSISGSTVKNVEITTSQFAGGLVGAMAAGAAGITTIENNLISYCKVGDDYATEDTLIAPNDSVNATLTLTLSNNTIEPQPAAAVAKIGGNQYPTLAAAIAAVPANTETTIQLIGNITDMETVTVAAGKIITLDLNGHSIATAVKSGSGNDTRHYYAIDNYGTFTLKDTDGAGEIRARGIENLGDGIMTIEGGKIVAVDANGGAAIWNEAALTISGGALETTHVGSSSDTYGPGGLNNSGTATITGGSITSVNMRTYAIVSSGNITITPAENSTVTVVGAHGGLAIDSGTATVNGGSYTSTDYYGLWITNDGNCTDVTVNGGNFQGGATGKNAIRASVDDGKQDVSDATIRITGGTFTGYETNAAAVAMNKSKSAHSWGMAISGGTFSTEPDESYIAEGYAAIASGAVWIVKPVVTTNNDNAVTVDTSSSYTVDTTSVNAETSVKESISQNTNVSGVKLSTSATVPATESSEEKSGLQAVVDAAKAGDSITTSEAATAAIAEATSIDVDVKVTVTPTAYTNDNTAQTATFKLEPKATVTATKTENDVVISTTTIENVAVDNDMIDQNQDITVNLYTGFPPQQIIHRADNGEIIDVFNAGQFNYANGVATVTIHHFSTLEVSAESGVAEINGHKYATLADAFDAATDGQTITLLQNVSLTDRLFVNAGTSPAYAGAGNRYATTSDNKSITLDLNGKNITSSSNIALAGGSLNITGTGKISTSASGLAPIEIRGTGDLTSKRTLTIDSGVTLEGEEYGLNVFGSNDAQKNLIDVTVHGTVNGTLFVLGNLTNTENEINIVVDGTVNGGSEEVGIALNGYGNVTVNNGANVSGKTGIEVRAGELTVNGGTITGTGAYAAPTHNGSGTTSSGAAVAVAQHTTNLPINVTLNGGDLSATSGASNLVVVADPENQGNIAGSDTAAVQVVATQSFTENSNIPSDYEWVKVDNDYTLREKPVKALGGSLRKRAYNGDADRIVYTETDLRFGFKVTDVNKFSTENSYFTYNVTGGASGQVTAENIDETTGTTNLVLTKVPSTEYDTDITVTLYMYDDNNIFIGTAEMTKSVCEVAENLLASQEYAAWHDYATAIKNQQQ